MMEAETISKSSSQVASEARSVFEGRITDCVNNAFDAIGTSPIMEDYILCRLSMGAKDIVENPRNFIRALEEIFGVAGASVYEYQLVRQIRRDFGLLQDADSKLTIIGKRLPGEMLRAAIAAADSVR